MNATEQQRRNSIKRHGRLMPIFAFIRDSDIEAEGFLLAGRLFADVPHRKLGKNATRQMVSEIIRNLMANRDRLGRDTVTIGWPGAPPSDASAVKDNDALMTAWVDKCPCIGVRVAPGEYDGSPHLDSELLQQIGLAVQGPVTKH